MRRLFQHFTRAHLYCAVGFYLVFAGLTFWAMSKQSVSDRRENWNITATVGAASGPFTGALARQWQSCCREFSLTILPYCAAILSVGVLFQIIPLPFPRFEKAVRLIAWCLGLLGWFGGGVVSLGHALS